MDRDARRLSVAAEAGPAPRSQRRAHAVHDPLPCVLVRLRRPRLLGEPVRAILPRRSATCAPVRPRVASTPRFAATTSGFCRCGALIDGSVKWGSPRSAAVLTGSGGRVDVAAKTPQHRESAQARPPWVVEEPPETSPPGSRRSWSGSPRPSPRCTGLPAQGRTPAGPPTRPPEMTHGSVRRAVFRRALVARPFTGTTGARRAHR